MEEIIRRTLLNSLRQKNHTDSPNLHEDILRYIQLLTNKDLPPILNLYYLGMFTETDPELLATAISAPHTFYREFRIPKRKGDERIIEAPIPSLLICQRWICKNLLEKVELNVNATAYRKGIDLLKNTKPHLNQNELLKIDLKDFFHSITLKRVIATFRSMGYLPKISYELASLCCVNGRLPQGGATSPLLSNIIAKRMDKRLEGLALKNKLNYTRYSDDITFSGEKISINIIYAIRSIIEEEGFNINSEKTRHYKTKGRRVITGISVSSNVPKLPKHTKREIRQAVYELLKQPNNNHIGSGNKDVFFLESLRGKLSFWQYVEPDAEYPRKMLQKLEYFAAVQAH